MKANWTYLKKKSVAQRLNLPDLRSGYTFGYDQDIRKNFVLPLVILIVIAIL